MKRRYSMLGMLYNIFETACDVKMESKEKSGELDVQLDNCIKQSIEELHKLNLDYNYMDLLNIDTVNSIVRRILRKDMIRKSRTAQFYLFQIQNILNHKTNYSNNKAKDYLTLLTNAYNSLSFIGFKYDIDQLTNINTICDIIERLCDEVYSVAKYYNIDLNDTNATDTLKCCSEISGYDMAIDDLYRLKDYLIRNNNKQ